MDREKTHIKRENFIAVQGWMILDLDLKGNELLIYACIYGFSQTENQWFTGGRQYLADWTNSTKQGVQKCLNSLVAKGLIEKMERYENGVKFCDYRVTEFTSQQSLPVNKVDYPSQQSLPGVGNKVDYPSQQSLPGVGNKVDYPSQQSLPNNINNNIVNNKKDNIKENIEDNIKSNPRKKAPQTYYPDELLNQTFLDYIAMRKTIKKPMTDRAIELTMKKLNKLATPGHSFCMDNDLAIKILEQSIMSCWQGLYPLKETKTTTKKNDMDEWRELYEQYRGN